MRHSNGKQLMRITQLGKRIPLLNLVLLVTVSACAAEPAADVSSQASVSVAMNMTDD